MIRMISIGTRSWIAFSTVGMLVVIIGAYAMIRLNHLNESIDHIVEKRASAIEVSTSYLASYYLVRLQVANVLSVKDNPERLNHFNQNYLDALKSFKQSQDLLKTTVDGNAEKNELEKLSRYYDEYLTLSTKQMALVKQGKVDEAKLIQDSEHMAKVKNGVATAITNLIKTEKSAIKVASQDADITFSSALKTILSIIVACLVIVIFFAWTFTKSLTGPVSNVIDIAKSIAGGDLTQKVQVTGNDEMSDLLKAIMSMQLSLQSTIQAIQSVASKVENSSEQIQNNSTLAEEGVIKQNDQLTQAASAIGQLVFAVEEVASRANQTSQQSDEADSLSFKGSERVKETLITVEQLSTNLLATTKNTEQLADQVNEISGVLSVIRDIADQTNLLALNAAIEAARAGETGRGFAVVADEVRALAHRTQESTKEIECMSDRVRQGTSSTVAAMRESYDQVQNTLVIAKEAGQALNEITARVSEIKDQNISVAGATEEQAQASKEVGVNINHIRELAITMSSSASKSKSAGQDLNRVAIELKAVVSKFIA